MTSISVDMKLSTTKTKTSKRVFRSQSREIDRRDALLRKS